MSETCQLEIDRVDGPELHATLRLCHPDESTLWTSPAAIACLLQQAAEDLGLDDLSKDLARSGFDIDLEADDDDELAALNHDAEKWIASVQVGPVQNARVVESRPGGVRVERSEDADDDPCVALVIRLVEPAHAAHLPEGYRLATIQSRIG